MTTARAGARATAVLVPVKAFGAAKARLAGRVSPADRAALARWMATRVVDAVRPLTTFVACDDEAVADWAESLGAHVLWGPGLGLNGAVDGGVATVSGKGFDRIVITHGDLPLPDPLAELGATTGHRPDDDTIVLVPDRRHDGTNVVVRPCDVWLPASYGAGSFRRHLHHALASDHPVTVRVDARLSLDLDTWADLRHPMIRPHVDAFLAGRP